MIIRNYYIYYHVSFSSIMNLGRNYDYYWFLMVSPRIRSPQHPKAPRPAPRPGSCSPAPRTAGVHPRPGRPPVRPPKRGAPGRPADAGDPGPGAVPRQGQFSGMIPVITSKSLVNH